MEVPDFIAKAIAAQGKTTPEEVAEKMTTDDLVTVEPEPTPTPEEEQAMEQEQLDFGGDLCPACGGTRHIFNRAGTEIPCPTCNAPPNGPSPPVDDDPPELPRGRGLTAMEAAELLAEDWRKRETLRRRAQELEEPYRLLRVIGRRPGATTKRDQQVYALTDLGREALATWDAGQSWQAPHPLARGGDPATAQEAARSIRPGVDFHRVLDLYARAR